MAFLANMNQGLPGSQLFFLATQSNLLSDFQLVIDFKRGNQMQQTKSNVQEEILHKQEGQGRNQSPEEKNCDSQPNPKCYKILLCVL